MPEKTQPPERTRTLTVIAQDPSVRNGRGILTVELEIPYEKLDPGPRGARVHVIDYDSSNNVLYSPWGGNLDKDLFKDVTDPHDLVGDPRFHAQNTYAIIMATVARFEHALGRRAPFAFPAGSASAAPGRGHMVKAAPHAFGEANAFYSRRDEALLFGYFPISARENVFTCLSHDIVAHEASHMLLDGLRPRYSDPSSADQAAFHEGFADVVALLSVIRNSEVIGFGLNAKNGRIKKRDLTTEALKRSALLGLAEQMGAASQMRGDALRRSVNLEPDPGLLERADYCEPHRRGEVFAAAVMQSFLHVWRKRLEPLLETNLPTIDAARVAEEGAHAAAHLLTMCIRAIDYAPPVDLQFEDFLTALLTADREIYPDDTKFGYREVIKACFGKFGIRHGVHGLIWNPPPQVSLARNHFNSLQREPDEVFHFLWENWKALELHRDAFTYVASVRPCTRVDTDGFTLNETVAEYVQVLTLEARELGRLKIRKPDEMRPDFNVNLYGGGVLVFDEFGRLKYHVLSRVGSAQKQTKRLQHLWDSGFYGDRQALRRFAQLHRARALDVRTNGKERW